MSRVSILLFAVGCGGAPFESTLIAPPTSETDAAPLEAATAPPREASPPEAAPLPEAQPLTEDAGQDAPFCVLPQPYNCGPEIVGSPHSFTTDPPFTFCLVTSTQPLANHIAQATPSQCQACGNFNCACLGAQYVVCMHVASCTEDRGQVTLTCQE